MHQSSAVLNVKFTLRGTRAVHRWCARTASMPSAGTVWSPWMMTFSWSTMTKGPVETNWGTPGRPLSGTEHRLWESLLALAFSCWLPLPSSSWPLPSYSAASASAAKAMMTHCQPKKHHPSWHREPLQGWAYLFLSFFTPFTFFFSHPTSFESFLLFWAQPAPAQAAWGSIALHEGWHGRKATLHVYLKGERCRGQRLVDMRLVEGLLCPNVWEVARLGTWTMTAPLQLPPPSSGEEGVNLLLHFGG